MYLRKVQRKNKDGTAVVYYQLAHNERHPQTRTPVARIIHSFGRADEIDTDELIRLCKSIARVCNIDVIEPLEDTDSTSIEQSREIPLSHNIKLIKTGEQGTITIIEALWERLGIPSILNKLIVNKQYFERALLMMTAHRLCEPESPIGLWEEWLEKVYFPSCQNLTQEQLLEVMNVFQSHSALIEKELFFQGVKLINSDTDLVFYYAASVSFTIEEEEENTQHPLLVIALAVTPEGLPVRSWIFPGTFSLEDAGKQVKTDLADWNLCHALMVSDKKPTSSKNKYLRVRAMDSLVEDEKNIFSRKGRYKIVRDDLHTKRMTTGEGENKKHYILCCNPKAAEQKRIHRAYVMQALEKEIARFSDNKLSLWWREHLLSYPTYKGYLKIIENSEISIDHAAIRLAEQDDGKWVVETNDDTLNAEDAVSGHHGLIIIKRFFEALEKTRFKHFPHFVWSISCLEAQVKICTLALFIEKIAELSTQQSWRDLRQKLGTFQSTEFHSLKQVFHRKNEANKEVKKIFKSLGISLPRSFKTTEFS